MHTQIIVKVTLDFRLTAIVVSDIQIIAKIFLSPDVIAINFEIELYNNKLEYLNLKLFLRKKS